VLVEWIVGDHHGRGVDGGVTRAALEGARDVPQLGHALLPSHHVGQGRRLLIGVVECDVERKVRHELGDAVDLGVRHAEYAPDVADGRLGAKRTERDDVSDPVPAVLVGHVADDLVAPVVGEVDVHVRHRDPLGVQESLEE
jgi:hypothetical protein